MRQASIPFNQTTGEGGAIPGPESVRGIINMSGVVSVGVPWDKSGCGCQKLCINYEGEEVVMRKTYRNFLQVIMKSLKKVCCKSSF